MGLLRLVTGMIGLPLAAGLLSFVAITEPAVAQVQDHQYSTTDIQIGFRLYGAQCALCHGANGDGIAGVNLARQQFRRASSDDDIRNIITTGVAAAGMPAFRLQAAELDSLIAYIRSGFDIGGAAFKVGNAVRGRAIYDKSGCAACHRVNGNGARTAPDLSDIGAVRQPAAIQRSLRDPSQGVLPINRPVRVVTRDGRNLRGRRMNEDTFTVQLIDQNEKLVSILKSDIRQYEIGAQTEMPSFNGTDEELADLLAYLISLRGL
jgi:putative heme-binding domain-containing protein